MFYCDTCAGEKNWPQDTLVKSFGPCEVCGRSATCNDVPSRQLTRQST